MRKIAFNGQSLPMSLRPSWLMVLIGNADSMQFRSWTVQFRSLDVKWRPVVPSEAAFHDLLAGDKMTPHQRAIRKAGAKVSHCRERLHAAQAKAKELRDTADAIEEPEQEAFNEAWRDYCRVRDSSRTSC
jgi:hypothetical protein